MVEHEIFAIVDQKITSIQTRLLIAFAGFVAAVSTSCSSSDSSSTGVASTTPAPRHTPVIDWMDFISFGGTNYQSFRNKKESPFQEEDLGQVWGHVAFRYEGNVSDPGYSLKNGKDGDAAFHEVGTPIHIIKGYKPEFILAAHINGQLSLYMSDSQPDAETGSDLMDLEGKVKYIGVNSSRDGKTELVAITDQPQIDSLVRMILDVPVDLNICNDLDSDVNFLAFHLNDGITFTRGYCLQINQFNRSIQLPRDFPIAIGNALQLSG